jgi:hypothetical protein
MIVPLWGDSEMYDDTQERHLKSLELGRVSKLIEAQIYELQYVYDEYGPVIEPSTAICPIEYDMLPINQCYWAGNFQKKLN